MSDEPKTIIADDPPKHDHEGFADRMRHSISSANVEPLEDQIYSMADIDPALDAKLRLVNAVRLALPSLSPTPP